MATHTLYIGDTQGRHLRLIDDVLKATYSLVLNQPGVLVFTVPQEPTQVFIRYNARIDMFRDGVRVGGTAWYVRKWVLSTDEQGRKLLEVTAYSAVVLLSSRIIGYKASSQEAMKVGDADDILIEIINENFGNPSYPVTGDIVTGSPLIYNMSSVARCAAGYRIEPAPLHLPVLPAGCKIDYVDTPTQIMLRANATATAVGFPFVIRPNQTWRDVITSGYLAVGTSLGSCPTISKGVAYRSVLRACQEIADASTAGGVPLFFDITINTNGVPEFNVYPFHRGAYRVHPYGVPVSEDIGNLATPKLTYDYTESASVIYTAGQGTEEARDLISVEDDLFVASSIWGRNEVLVDARNNANANTMFDEALQSLRERRRKVSLSGRILDIPGSRYGVDWEWGDILTVSYLQYSVDCFVRSVQVSLQEEEEIIDSTIESVA